VWSLIHGLSKLVLASYPGDKVAIGIDYSTESKHKFIIFQYTKCKETKQKVLVNDVPKKAFTFFYIMTTLSAFKT